MATSRARLDRTRLIAHAFDRTRLDRTRLDRTRLNGTRRDGATENPP